MLFRQSYSAADAVLCATERSTIDFTARHATNASRAHAGVLAVADGSTRTAERRTEPRSASLDAASRARSRTVS